MYTSLQVYNDQDYRQDLHESRVQEEAHRGGGEKEKGAPQEGTGDWRRRSST